MRLLDTATAPSPQNPDCVRFEARFEVESLGQVLHYWFDFPEDLQSSQCKNGNPWLILMLPLACHFGEPITIDRPVDRALADNLKGLQQVWQSWYPELHIVDIHAKSIASADRLHGPEAEERRTISCFSGGVDSFFTLFRHLERAIGDGSSTIDDLLTIAGFNTPMEDFRQQQKDLAPAAEKLGRRLIPVMTNIRYGAQPVATPYSIEKSMIGYAHGPLLAAIVHMLEPRYKEFILPASHHFANLMPYGSHPLTDRLLSSAELSVVHDGASFARIERTQFIAQFDIALQTLHVCWQDYSRGNCSRCQKCLRTMAALDLLGARDRAKSFDWTNYSIERLSHVWLTSVSDAKHYIEIAQVAEKLHRDEIVDAAYASVSFSNRKRALLKLINSNIVSRMAWQGLRAIRNEIATVSH